MCAVTLRVGTPSAVRYMVMLLVGTCFAVGCRDTVHGKRPFAVRRVLMLCMG